MNDAETEELLAYSPEYQPTWYERAAASGMPLQPMAQQEAETAALRKRAAAAEPEPPPLPPSKPQEMMPAAPDWERAIAGLVGRQQGIASLDQSRLARRRQMLDEQNGAIDRRMKAGELADRQNERATKLAEVRAAMDPNSELSKSAAESYAQTNMARAAILAEKNPTLAAAFAARARGATGKSRLELAQAMKADQETMGELLKMLDSQAKQDLASENMGMRRDSAEAMRAMAGARFTETKQENQRRQDDREARRNEREAEAYGKDIAPLNEAEILADEAAALKKKANTGKVANWVQENIRKPIGFPDKDLLELESKQELVNAAIRKAEAGLSLTASERELLRRTTPQQDMDDIEYEQKQRGRIEQIKLRQEQVRKKHPQTTGANPAGAAKSKADKARRALAKDSGATATQRAGAEAYLRSIGEMP